MPETLYKLRCPYCGRKHAVPETYIGRVVLCQPCGKNFKVEAEPEQPQVLPDPDPPTMKMKIDPSDSELIDVDFWDKLGTIEEEDI